MKKGNLGKLALIGAGLYAAKVLTDKKEEEKTLNSLFAGLPQTTQTESGEIPFSPDQFKKWIDANPALKAALRSGVTAEQVIQNINNNVYSLDNVNYRNYSDSLLLNGALELGDLSHWAYANKNDSLGWNGFDSITNNSENYMANDTEFFVNLKKLIKINFQAKGVCNYTVRIQCFNRAGVHIGNAFAVIAKSLNSVPFIDQNLYVGGAGGTLNDFGANLQLIPSTYKCKIGFYAAANQLTISNLIVKDCELGESVPSNLVFLPVGQEVYDTTTGDRGRYNGTAVDWYTMV